LNNFQMWSLTLLEEQMFEILYAEEKNNVLDLREIKVTWFIQVTDNFCNTEIIEVTVHLRL
jgi:hypothetical protein